MQFLLEQELHKVHSWVLSLSSNDPCSMNMPLHNWTGTKQGFLTWMAVSHLQTSSSNYFEKMTTPIKKFIERMNQNFLVGTSLVAQLLRICLLMQGTQVRSLVREDPTCRRATKPVRHNYWACALEPASHNYWAHVLQLLKPARLEPMLRNKRSHRDEKPVHRNEE